MISTSASGRFAVALLIIAVALALAAPALAAAKGQKSPAAAAESKDPNHWFQKGALCATYGNMTDAFRDGFLIADMRTSWGLRIP